MAQILAHEPSYITSADLFKVSSKGSTSEAQSLLFPHVRHDGPLRTVAHRGSEIFVAIGNELRWTDLGALQDADEDRTWRRHGGREEEGRGTTTATYRLLKPPTPRPITALSVSPSGTYLAILTSHTAHIALLPPSYPSTTQSPPTPTPTVPHRLKSYHLGPTSHVLETSPLVTALWHPLAPPGQDVLVTVTHDACVRLWELDTTNRSSFSEPALAVDLKKLANATSASSDLSASRYGENKGFSPDEVEMQVAGACFGGSGGGGEDGWAGMTLWVAMTEGDVYALSPLLPSQWTAGERVLGSLSTSVVEKARGLMRDAGATDTERRVVEQQRKWLSEVDAQDPLLLPAVEGGGQLVEVYSRPTGLSAVAKLQGPFQLAPEPDFGEITDIFVVPAKVDVDALYDDEDDGEEGEGGLSVGIICLATSTNEVHVCLSLDNVEAEWLPSKRSRSTYSLDDAPDDKELLLFETLDLAQEGSGNEDHGCPTFTSNSTDRYRVFVTHPGGVSSLDFSDWALALEDELRAPSEEGTTFRLDIVLESTQTLITNPIAFPPTTTTQTTTAPIDPPTTAIAIATPHTGETLLLTLSPSNNNPYATLLGPPSDAFAPSSPITTKTPNQLSLPAPPPRAPYRPSPSFTTPSTLPALLDSPHASQLGVRGTSAPLRFSPATLQFLNQVHRTLSAETHALATGVAELLRVCERMRTEIAVQVERVAEVGARVDGVVGEADEDGEQDGEEGGEEDGDVVTGKERIADRVEVAREKREELAARMEALRRRVGSLRGGRGELSAKEKGFGEEVARLERSLLASSSFSSSPSDDPGTRHPEHESSSLLTRFATLQSLHATLLDRVQEAVEVRTRPDDGKRASASLVGGEVRRQRLESVRAMLERETALVEGVGERLRRLQG